MVGALRDLDRMDGHQPFAEMVAREFKQRPAPSRKCPNCGGPIDGWMAGWGGQVVWCSFCTTFEEASAHLSKMAGPPPKPLREWYWGWRWFYVNWGTYSAFTDHRRTLDIRIGPFVVTFGDLRP
jgi:hypothetical protein